MKRIGIWILHFAAALGFLLILITATPILRPWISALSTEWGDERGDILIMLGGEITAQDMMGPGSYWRTYYGMRYSKQIPFRKIILAGKEVAPLMRRVLIGEGVPPDKITLEDRSVSTHENAVFVADLLRGDAGRKILLTSDFHMGRALRAFRKAGIEASPLPIPDARKRMNDPLQRWTIFLTLVQETGKSIYYAARGWA